MPRAGISVCEQAPLKGDKLTTGISAGLKSVTPASINLIGCWPEAAEVFLLISQVYMR